MLSLAMVCLQVTAVIAISSLPPQSAVNIVTQTAPYSQEGALKPATTNTAFTVTTATTQWVPPAFPTSTPLPACSDSICPAYDGKTCVDSLGYVYGVLCDQKITGLPIVSAGKERLLMERDDEDLIARAYTGSLDGCTGSCDEFDKQFCVGVGYLQGSCTMYDAIMGTVPQPGAIACIRQT